MSSIKLNPFFLFSFYWNFYIYVKTNLRFSKNSDIPIKNELKFLLILNALSFNFTFHNLIFII